MSTPTSAASAAMSTLAQLCASPAIARPQPNDHEASPLSLAPPLHALPHRIVRTFCTSSSRADTGPDAPPLHPAMRSLPLRERAGRLARDTTTRLQPTRGHLREKEARIVRSCPPASSPLRVLIPLAPPGDHRLVAIMPVTSGSGTEGPAGSGVNGLTPGPLRLLGRLTPAGQGPAVDDTRLPPPPFTIAS